MKLNWKAPGGERTWLAALALIGGVALAVAGGRHFDRFEAVLGGVWLLTGVGLWFRQRWARWLALGAFGACIAWFIWMVSLAGFAWSILAAVAGCGVATWRIWRRFSPAALDEDQPLTSLVLLLRETRYLEAKVLAEIVSSAWGGQYGVAEGTEPESGRWVIGESPHFVVFAPEGLFAVHNVPSLYFTDLEDLAEELPELRLRKAIQEHQAWLSVDLLTPFDDTAARESFYPQIARLVAELAGPDCLCLLQPETGKLNIYDASLEEKLRQSESAEELFAPPFPPVVDVADDEPRLKAAVAEARRRWPEFVEAFRRRQPEELFAVKVPMTHGDRTEVIWVEVQSIQREVIFGKLGNDPIELGDLKYGTPVEVPIADVCDWTYLRGEELVGGFSAKVLQDIATERGRKSRRP
jgi:uncharacterized protein YegJ (DUF2314 family)